MSKESHYANISRPRMKQRYPDRQPRSQAQLAHLKELVGQSKDGETSRTQRTAFYRSRVYQHKIFTGSLDPMRIASDIAYKAPTIQSSPFTLSPVTNPIPSTSARSSRESKPFYTGDSIPLGSNLYTYQGAPTTTLQRQPQHSPHSLPVDSPKDALSELPVDAQRSRDPLEPAATDLSSPTTERPGAWTFASQTSSQVLAPSQIRRELA
jgi:hypothetical protein